MIEKIRHNLQTESCSIVIKKDWKLVIRGVKKLNLFILICTRKVRGQVFYGKAFVDESRIWISKQWTLWLREKRWEVCYEQSSVNRTYDACEKKCQKKNHRAVKIYLTLVHRCNWYIWIFLDQSTWCLHQIKNMLQWLSTILLSRNEYYFYILVNNKLNFNYTYKNKKNF